MDIVTPMDAANLHMAPPPRHAKLELPADEKKLWCRSLCWENLSAVTLLSQNL